MKLGLSTWSLLKSDVYSAVKSIGDAGVEQVELWGEAPHAFPGWVDKGRLKDALSSYNMVVTMHAPFSSLNLAWPFEPVKSAIVKALKEVMDLGSYLDAAVVTLHPGSIHSEALVPDSLKSCVESLRSLGRECNHGMVLSVENQMRGRSGYQFPLGSSVEAMEVLLGQVEGARFTLDTGHAYADGLDPMELARRFGRELVEVHLHDNGGRHDEHLIPGEGSARLKPLIEFLAQKDVVVCLELDPFRYSGAQALGAVSGVRDWLEK